MLGIEHGTFCTLSRCFTIEPWAHLTLIWLIASKSALNPAAEGYQMVIHSTLVKGKYFQQPVLAIGQSSTCNWSGHVPLSHPLYKKNPGCATSMLTCLRKKKLVLLDCIYSTFARKGNLRTMQPDHRWIFVPLCCCLCFLQVPCVPWRWTEFSDC